MELCIPLLELDTRGVCVCMCVCVCVCEVRERVGVKSNCNDHLRNVYIHFMWLCVRYHAVMMLMLLHMKTAQCELTSGDIILPLFLLHGQDVAWCSALKNARYK